MRTMEAVRRSAVGIAPERTIGEAAALMDQTGVGALAIIDHDRLVGIVTDRDLVVKVMAGGGSPDATVRDAMTPNPTAVREDDDVQRAVSAMKERQVRRMPVVDRDGRLTGIIAQADVATRVNRDETTGELVEAISEPGNIRK